MSSTHTPGSRGATPLNKDDGRRKRPWWLLLAAAVVAVVVLLLLLSRCGGGDDAADTSGTSPSSAASDPADSSSTSPSTAPAPSAEPSPSETTTPSSGTGAASNGAAGDTVLTSGGTSLLPTATAPKAVSLRQYVGQPAQGRGVQVLTVPADEGFFVGTSDSDRVWVQLTGSGESGYQVKAGDLVDFTGSVVANPPGFAESVGLTPAEGAARLKAVKGHVEADRASVKLSQG